MLDRVYSRHHPQSLADGGAFYGITGRGKNWSPAARNCLQRSQFEFYRGRLSDDGWGRLSVDGPGQNNLDRARAPGVVDLSLTRRSIIEWPTRCSTGIGAATRCAKGGSKPDNWRRSLGRHRLKSHPSSRTGENPQYGMSGRTMETSASFEARSAPCSCPTGSRVALAQRVLGYCGFNFWPYVLADCIMFIVVRRDGPYFCALQLVSRWLINFGHGRVLRGCHRRSAALPLNAQLAPLPLD